MENKEGPRRSDHMRPSEIGQLYSQGYRHLLQRQEGKEGKVDEATLEVEDVSAETSQVEAGDAK